MLSLYSRFIAKDIPDAYGNPTSYTIFGDTESKDTFYLLPEFPSFLPNPATGAPSFSMVWYYGKKITPGGVCTFTVGLPLPDTHDPKVRKLLSAAIGRNADLSFRAQKILELAQSSEPAVRQQIAKEIGLTDAQATAYAAAYDKTRDYTQFLPSDDTLIIKAVPITSGTVTVQAFGSPDLYASWKDGNAAPTETRVLTVTPSFLNSNAAVVSFDLTEKGAAMFWFAMGGPSFEQGEEPAGYDAELQSSVVAVTYAVGFDAVLPAAEAVVTLNHNTIMSLVQTRSKDTWGHEKIDKIEKKYSQTVKDAITLTLPSSAYLASKDAKASVEASLQDWAQKQLESMMESQVPALKLADMSDDIDNSSFSSLQDQTRTFRLSQAINFTARPQGQLPSIRQLLPKGADPHQFFRSMDLNQRPYFRLDLVLTPPSKTVLTALQVDALTISRIEYGGQSLTDKTAERNEVHALAFRPASEDYGAVTLEGTFDSRKKDSRKVLYSYVVTYADGSQPYKVAEASADEDNQVYFSGADLGVVYATFLGSDLPWGVVDEAQVTVKYEDDFTRQFSLKEKSLPFSLAKPIGRKVDRPIQYRLVLVLKNNGGTILYPADGESFVPAPIAGDADPKIYLKSGISHGNRNYTFSLSGSDVERAQIRASYTLPVEGAHSRVFDTTITLSKGGASSYVWQVPAPSVVAGDDSPALRIIKARAFDASTTPHELKIGSFDGTVNYFDVSLASVSGW